MTMRPRLVPELHCSDLDKSLAFYVGLLGFRILYDRPEDRFAYLDRSGAELMLGIRAGRADAGEGALRAALWARHQLPDPSRECRRASCGRHRSRPPNFPAHGGTRTAATTPRSGRVSSSSRIRTDTCSASITTWASARLQTEQAGSGRLLTAGPDCRMALGSQQIRRFEQHGS